MSRSASIAPDLGDEPDLRPRETTAVDAAANPTTSAGAKVLAAIPINNVDGVSGDSISISSDPPSKRRRLSHATRSPHSVPLSTPLPSSSRPVTCDTTRAPPGVTPGVIPPIDLPVALSGIPRPHLIDSTATNCIRTTNRPISDRARISLESASTVNNSKKDDEDYLVAFAAKNSVPWNGSLTWPSNDLSRRQKRLAEMPPQREVRVRAKAVLALNDAIQHEAALAYTRGNVADHWCKRCAAGDGNFPMCVVVKGEMEGACANCHFGRKKGKCSLHKSQIEEASLEHAAKQLFHTRAMRELSGTPPLDATSIISRVRTPGERLDAKIQELAGWPLEVQLEHLDEATLVVSALIHLRDMRRQEN